MPLDSLIGIEADLPLTQIRLSGKIDGTIYIDDLRLSRNPSGLAPTAVLEDQTSTVPGAFALDPNYPNPFNSGTVIRFALPEDGEVELAVYNVAGQQVAKLVEGSRRAGMYTVNWDGRDNSGRALASGVYLYRLRMGKRQMETRKLLLLR